MLPPQRSITRFFCFQIILSVITLSAAAKQQATKIKTTDQTERKVVSQFEWDCIMCDLYRCFDPTEIVTPGFQLVLHRSFSICPSFRIPLSPICLRQMGPATRVSGAEIEKLFSGVDENAKGEEERFGARVLETIAPALSNNSTHMISSGMKECLIPQTPHLCTSFWNKVKVMCLFHQQGDVSKWRIETRHNTLFVFWC